MARKPQAPAEPAAPLAVTHAIDLAPADWRRATWRELPPLPRPPVSPPPFDLAKCVDRLSRVPVNRWGWWEWGTGLVPTDLSREEAHFWFLVLTQAVTQPAGRVLSREDEQRAKRWPAELAGRIAAGPLDGNVSPAQAQRALAEMQGHYGPPETVLRVLSHLLPVTELTLLMPEYVRGNRHWNTCRAALDWYTRDVFPYLTAAECADLRLALAPQLGPLAWPPGVHERPSVAFHLAALLGAHAPLEKVVASWPDNRYRGDPLADIYQEPQPILFGLADPRLVEHHFRRLGLRLRTSEHVRVWLAHTEFAALDGVRDAVLAVGRKDEALDRAHALALARGPEVAPIMLELRLVGKAPQGATEWFDANPGNAIAGLIPTAAGRGKLADAAVEYLRRARRDGHADFIAAQLAQATPEVAEKVRRLVLEYVEKVYPSFDDATPSEWWAAAVGDLTAKPAKLPDWLRRADLRPVVIGDRRLSDGQVRLVLEALRRSTLAEPHPLVTALRQRAEPAALDAFAWHLFDLWLTEGAAPREKWALLAVGLLGGDASVLKLTPLIRAWPGESQHGRAVTGLECLRAIGTDTALMQLNGIAQKLKFQGLKKKAREFMDAIARERGMSQEELEDRIVPDLDLDERGGRDFDFGSRRFRLVLGPDFKPMVRAEDGNLKADLPKPGAKDDAEKAAAAVAAWKFLKKQLREVVKTQAARLEQALATQRRWPRETFEPLLVKHPLMMNLARLLLWGGYDPTGRLVRTFRVTEDGECVDREDAAFSFDGLTAVGLAHPLHLSAAERSAWGEVFADYELIAPFGQLGRPTYALEPGDAEADTLTRFKGPKVPALALVGILEKLGWARGQPQDGGVFHWHWRFFPAHGLTAFIEYSDGIAIGAMDALGDQEIDACYLLPKLFASTPYPQREERVPFGRVDPVVVNEVLTALHVLASKGVRP